MKWEPVDIIRFAALVGGFLLCGLGSYLMWLGVGAQGEVNIRSTIVSGAIKTGSAGLFIIFFGFLIVLFVLATLTAKMSAAHATPSARKTKSESIGRAMAIQFVALIVSGALAAAGLGPGFGGLAVALGVGLLFTGFAYMEFATQE